MKTQSTQAQAAKQIREILKREFPNTKFSITSSSFSMGDDVNVKWIDGPTEEAVNDQICQFQYGHFNGMEDIYENSNARDDIPQTKYLMLSRNMSNETYEKITKEVNEKWGYHLALKTSDYGTLFVDPTTDEHTGSGWASQEIHKEFNKVSL